MPGDVSREAQNDLDRFESLVLKWNDKINLVAKGSELRRRHIEDSTQLADWAGSPTSWVDLGSGGGFPVIPCAIVFKHRMASTRFTLIESDRRKSAFLRTAIRELDLNADVVEQRIEHVQLSPPDLITARALTDLSTLMGMAHRLGNRGTRCLFLKGARHADEVAAAKQFWTFNLDVKPSITSSEAAILEITDFHRHA